MPRFSGVMTALVTPFGDDQKLDLDAFRALIEAQLAAGIHGLVPCGTTGEASTLTPEEHMQVVTTCRDVVKGRALVIAGAGANDTAKSVALHQKMHEAGVDAALHVTPWYNKPTQEGLYRHFRAIAESAPLPVVLYNVPGRTSVDMLPDTIVRLARDCPTIVGVKEATGSIQRAQELLAKLHGVRSDFAVLSGDDGLILGLYAIGGHGVISVMSHLCGRELVQMTEAFHAGRLDEAQRLSRETSPLSTILFWKTSPIPVKTALHWQGRMKKAVRLPLYPLDDGEEAQLRAMLVKAGARDGAQARA